MITRLLVPLDGSTHAEAALPVAAKIARALQGTLILLQIPDVPLSDLALSVIEAEEERAHLYLAQIAHRPELAGLPLETKTCCGTVARTILATIQAEQVDLLVMSSHGRSGFPRLALGSIAEQVISHTSIPVLVLPRPPVGEAIRRTIPVATVALDGSAGAETVLFSTADVLAALAAPDEGTLHLVRIVAPPVKIRASTGPAATHAERGDQTVQDAEDYLLRLDYRIQREGLAGHHPAVRWSLFVAQEIGPTLVYAAERAGPEASRALFLALASHGRGRWKAGSIAMSILEHRRLPLLLVRIPPRHDGAESGAFPDRTPSETPVSGQG